MNKYKKKKLENSQNVKNFKDEHFKRMNYPRTKPNYIFQKYVDDSLHCTKLKFENDLFLNFPKNNISEIHIKFV